MSLRSVAKQFVDLCNQGKNFDVMRTLYAPDIVSVEGDGSETAGQQPVIEKSERWVAVNTINSQKVVGPFFNGPNQFGIYFVHNVTPKLSGKPVDLDEVAIYTVKNDKITREQFFFAGGR